MQQSCSLRLDSGGFKDLTPALKFCLAEVSDLFGIHVACFGALLGGLLLERRCAGDFCDLAAQAVDHQLRRLCRREHGEPRSGVERGHAGLGRGWPLGSEGNRVVLATASARSLPPMTCCRKGGGVPNVVFTW